MPTISTIMTMSTSRTSLATANSSSLRVAAGLMADLARIGAIGALTILDLCGKTGDAFLCDRVHRNAATGDLWRDNNPATPGFVSNLTDSFGEQTFRGINFGTD